MALALCSASAAVIAQQPGYSPAPSPSYAPPGPSPQAPPAYYPPPAGTQQPGGAYATPAQGGQGGAVIDQVPPYHVHRDLNHGHDHVYPDRGSVLRDLPHGAVTVNYAGLSYQFADGVWFEPRGPAYLVVEPPIGLVVPTLPPFMTALNTGSETILYGNDTYYRARPDIGGYEVVNDPADSAPQSASMAGAATVAAAPVVVAAAAQPSATPALTPPPPAAAPPPVASVKNADDQARDQYECYRFAVSQTGFDPMRVNSAQAAAQQGNYERARSVCLSARGYSAGPK